MLYVLPVLPSTDAETPHMASSAAAATRAQAVCLEGPAILIVLSLLLA